MVKEGVNDRVKERVWKWSKSPARHRPALVRSGHLVLSKIQRLTESGSVQINIFAYYTKNEMVKR